MQVTIQVPAPPVPPVPPVPEIWVNSGPPEAVIMASVMIVVIIVAGVVLAPLVRALARRLEGKAVDAGLAADVEHLRGRVAELEAAQSRMAELEERVDFSERLLAQAREPQSRAPR